MLRNRNGRVILRRTGASRTNKGCLRNVHGTTIAALPRLRTSRNSTPPVNKHVCRNTCRLRRVLQQKPLTRCSAVSPVLFDRSITGGGRRATASKSAGIHARSLVMFQVSDWRDRYHRTVCRLTHFTDALLIKGLQQVCLERVALR